MFTSTPTPPGHIVMSQWNIVVLEFDTGEVIEKFLGLDESTGRYRISSEILFYDADASVGRTRSGSHYRFMDKPGRLHPEAKQVLDYLDSHSNITALLKFSQHTDS